MEMSFDQIISLSVLTTVVGMTVTFIILTFLMFLMQSLKYIGGKDKTDKDRVISSPGKGE